jgi:hypothetical protein
MTEFVFHAKPESPIRSTIVGLFDEATNTITLAAARCGKKDHFCKKTGRKIAWGRLNVGKIIATTCPQEGETPLTAFVETAKAVSQWLVDNTKPTQEIPITLANEAIEMVGF